MAKLYHPDITKDNGENFRKLKLAYDWLLENHKPVPRPKPKRDDKDCDRYYRTLDDTKTVQKISLFLPDKDKDIVIYCMRNNKEFRIFLNKGIQLPVTLEVTAGNQKLLLIVEEETSIFQ